MLPREHGAWALLIAPILVGLIGAPACSPAAAALFVLGSLAAFLVRTPLQALLARPGDRRAWRWAFFYSALVLAGFLPLIVLWGRTLLLLFAMPAILLLVENLNANRSGRRFSAVNEAAGVLGLCLGAPAAYYAASAGLGPRAWALWTLCAAYFLGPIFHVKMAALQHRAALDKKALPALDAMRRNSILYHALAWAAVLAWGLSGGIPTAAAIPFAAAFLKTFLRGAHEPERVDFRSLGFAEVGYSVLFVIVMVTL